MDMAKATVEMIKNVNDLMDILYSNQQFSEKPNKCAISEKNHI